MADGHKQGKYIFLKQKKKLYFKMHQWASNAEHTVSQVLELWRNLTPLTPDNHQSQEHTIDGSNSIFVTITMSGMNFFLIWKEQSKYSRKLQK